MEPARVFSPEVPELRRRLRTRWSRALVAATYIRRTSSAAAIMSSRSFKSSNPGVQKRSSLRPKPTSTLPPARSKRAGWPWRFPWELMPVRTTTGNSSPLAAWTVITRTDSSSDSGTGDSVTRAPSAHLVFHPPDEGA